MIIERKYEIIGELINNDERAASIIKRELLSRFDEAETNRILECDFEIFMYRADIGSGIPNLKLVIDELNKLDKEVPYDNGLTYKDVTDVEILPSKQGKAAVLVMISAHADTPKRIVNVIAVENNGDQIELIKPWNIDNVIF